MTKRTLLLILLSAHLNSYAQNCPIPSAQMDLAVNNVRAKILNGGDLWWDPAGQSNTYTVPIDSGVNAIYAGSIWLGGIDLGGQVYVAAQTYRQSGANDFWPGPISKNSATGILTVSNATCNTYDNLYHISKSEVANFVNNGITTPAITGWPGNGNVTTGELPYLAPFFDANNDGLYDYNSGDYPYFNLSNSYPLNSGTGQLQCDDYLFGDECIWWVFNDIGNVKTETNSNPIGLEIRAQAFAYSMPGSPIDNTVFYKYQIINRSSTTYEQFQAGFWVDPDLGNAADDYVGCDVGRSIGYAYNGDADDDGGYGLYPPAIGLDYLQGPIADIFDATDNDRDGFVDENGEQCLMNSFLYYENINGVSYGNPGVLHDYYSYLQGKWKNNIPVTYGGNGRGAGPGSTSTATTFMFPDNTDPNFTTPWTMNSGGLQPNDMRFVMSAGQFTMSPGEVNYISFASIWARSNVPSALPSIDALQTSSDIVQDFFDNCFTTTGIPEANLLNLLQVGPNPFTNTTTLNPRALKGGNYILSVYNTKGQLVETIKLNDRSPVITIGSSWSKGVYFLILQGASAKQTAKVVKM
ncbi:MAG: T9SS type A sorting domain-containing protein [Bacteroidia bacterium]|nr:T9SS type A sorting domain-containing protein [Bacteroidia bacterium]